MKKPSYGRRSCLGALIIAVWGVILLIAILFMVVTTSPMAAAQGADMLRAVIGDQAVSFVEMAIFQMQDTFLKWRYDLGFVTPAAPWADTAAQTPSPVPTHIPPTPTSAIVTSITASQATAPVAATASPMPVIWQPGVVTPFGPISGEGDWSAYIQDSQGRTVAYRTFVVPDPTRSYTMVGIVAFDMNLARLHFVLGVDEPFSPDAPKRSGAIPAADKAPGVLLATFNGGFKARHGHFGAMADGIVALPPRAGLATLVINKDGTLQMGEWGSEITSSPEMEAWRQNGPFVIHNDQINPDINANLPLDWGYTVNDVSPTWRSGISLSKDGRSLYYFCGPSLSMETLAKSMLAVQGADDGMQLDINTYWVHFVAVRDVSAQLQLEALFPTMMNENIDRYLFAYTRDYFYVTSK